MNRKSLIPTIATAVALSLATLTQLLAQVSSDSMESITRQAKSARYNGGPCDLTKSDDCGFEHFAPGPLPLIPVKESAIVFVGRVTKMQQCLSADRTHIYTEITLIVGELFKGPENFTLPADRTVTIDRIGGEMRLRSGRVIRDGSKIEVSRGQPYVGGRYVLFVENVHQGQDLGILRAYELRDGKVFKLTEDGSPGKVLLSTTPNKPDSFSDEQEFLQIIRKHDSADPKTGNLHLTIPTPTTP